MSLIKKRMLRYRGLPMRRSFADLSTVRGIPKSKRSSRIRTAWRQSAMISMGVGGYHFDSASQTVTFPYAPSPKLK